MEKQPHQEDYHGYSDTERPIDFRFSVFASWQKNARDALFFTNRGTAPWALRSLIGNLPSALVATDKSHFRLPRIKV
jgi:hypothetical protein